MNVIAFYLPQYHPIPENDEWWGKGFTEWRNVAKARPLFRGHYQPHLPADLGFYDLRLPETRIAQAELAARYGISGFCYYHYWFNGRRLLNRPFDEVLGSGEPDFPFCLCWANENWTRVWDGGSRDVLLGQNYSQEDDVAHMRWLTRAFSDSRYIRVEGKPLFLVYRASQLPDVRRTTDVWRETAEREGIGEIYLCNVQSMRSEHVPPSEWGFDAAVEFAPDWTQLSRPMGRSFRHRLLRHIRGTSPFLEHRIQTYEQLMTRMLSKPTPCYPRFPCVTPMWDNHARRQKDARIFVGSHPQIYERWFEKGLSRAMSNNSAEPVCFINAWNEWAEGNHLEPCQKWGHAYLEATARAISRVTKQTVSQAPVKEVACCP